MRGSGFRTVASEPERGSKMRRPPAPPPESIARKLTSTAIGGESVKEASDMYRTFESADRRHTAAWIVRHAVSESLAISCSGDKGERARQRTPKDIGNDAASMILAYAIITLTPPRKTQSLILASASQEVLTDRSEHAFAIGKSHRIKGFLQAPVKQTETSNLFSYEQETPTANKQPSKHAYQQLNHYVMRKILPDAAEDAVP